MDAGPETPASSERRRPARSAVAWVDGRVLPASEATVPLMDDGFLRGDAVFDSVLVRGGRTHALDRHLERLRRSARAIGIRVPVLTRPVADLLAAWGDGDGALKIVVTRGGAVRGIIQQVEHPASLALHVVSLPWRTALSGVKTLSYATNQHALRLARAAHADDALVVNEGIVQELPTAAVCIVRDDVVTSPDPEQEPILDSVTVRELDDLVGVERARLAIDDVLGADEVFVVSATRPVLPVHAIDDHEFPSPGETTARLAHLFDEHIRANLDERP